MELKAAALAIEKALTGGLKGEAFEKSVVIFRPQDQGYRYVLPENFNPKGCTHSGCQFMLGGIYQCPIKKKTKLEIGARYQVG